ncbi:hypothetical protein SAMN05421788_109127 [Filimonas lacunae]|uniref:Uncharacterized protein n=1 Tax=Filimonas lacunae TaxID=477680 RepID=A0A1N7R4X1_9BACT|nr:hypothetical protein SAMN05421788_109127 [Filimonas lacunae]
MDSILNSKLINIKWLPARWPLVLQKAMALPKKLRGFRKVMVEGKCFYWRFASVIDIRPAMQKQNRLSVDFGWYDTWLYINDDPAHRPPPFVPLVVSPGVVKQAILFALSNRWNTDKKNGLIQLTYKNQQFFIK